VPETIDPAELTATAPLLFIVLSLPLYSLALWGILKILDADLRWTQCSAVIAITMAMRMWDRGLFGQKRKG
jgi:hypothetical protein|tara:strand:- start:1041 stop:1253 length:213 start_codon:yes stop_codon:yes gene_type:complete